MRDAFLHAGSEHGFHATPVGRRTAGESSANGFRQLGPFERLEQKVQSPSPVTVAGAGSHGLPEAGPASHLRRCAERAQLPVACPGGAFFVATFAGLVVFFVAAASSWSSST